MSIDVAYSAFKEYIKVAKVFDPMKLYSCLYIWGYISCVEWFVRIIFLI